MFITPNSVALKPERRVLAASLVAHALLFAWLLHSPAPQLLNPQSVGLGHNGNVTTLYFPTKNPDSSNTSSPEEAKQVYRRQRISHQKLILDQKAVVARLAVPQQLTTSSAQDQSKSATLSKMGQGALVGRTYGGIPGSPIDGDEIRPALPVATVDPVVYPWELPDEEGNVVVEITIDARGEIIDKTILHSMGNKLDDKFLDALKSWRFQPATHNGIAIASKQDAVFHFKARGQA